jgi:hypothetical protein
MKAKITEGDIAEAPMSTMDQALEFLDSSQMRLSNSIERLTNRLHPVISRDVLTEARNGYGPCGENEAPLETSIRRSAQKADELNGQVEDLLAKLAI